MSESDNKAVAATANGEIRVTVPVSVLNDLEAFQQRLSLLVD